jgi:purine-binding chemotaxis protein CheW
VKPAGTGGRVNWDETRRRLEQAAPADPDHPARRRQVLRERAATLARLAPVADSADAGTIEVLAFEVGGERYAVETARVAQATPMLALTALPGVPNHVAGITAWRGEVLAVLDLRSLLALPLARLAEPSALVVLQGAGIVCALLADTIAGVCRYPRAALEGAVPGLGHIRAGYLLGVAPDRTAILDAAALLGDPRLIVNVGQ